MSLNPQLYMCRQISFKHTSCFNTGRVHLSVQSTALKGSSNMSDEPEAAKSGAAPFTPETVTEAVKEVDLDQLSWCLYASQRVDDIKSRYPAKDHVKVLVDWWFSTDPAPSWRRLIYRLDASLFLSTTADKIRHNAEPVEDPTFTLQNVTAALESVDNQHLCTAIGLEVPSEKCVSREEVLQYFVTTVPDTPWQFLAGSLYKQEEQAALENVTKYFQRQLEATLTLANLCSVLQKVEWETMTRCFDVPWTILEEIQEKYSNITQRKQAVLEEWLNHHPAPCWMLLVSALYRTPYMGSGYCGFGKHRKVLQLVKQKYLNATGPLSDQSVSSTDSFPTPLPVPGKTQMHYQVHREEQSSLPSHALTPQLADLESFFGRVSAAAARKLGLILILENDKKSMFLRIVFMSNFKITRCLLIFIIIV